MRAIEEKLTERREVVYKFEGIDPEEGIDVYELSPFLHKFADLVRETSKELGNDRPIEVRIKPFKQGSFITEFVVTYGSSLIDLLTSDGMDALTNVLTVLGFALPTGCALPDIVRRVKGEIHRFTDNGDGSYTYGEGAGSITVSGDVHGVVQSQAIAPLFKDVATGPLSRLNIGQVVICSPDSLRRPDLEPSSFTKSDRRFFDRYAEAVFEEPPEEEELHTTEMHGILLNPVSGPYDGTENGYTFRSGESAVYKKVKIEDDSFRRKLETTEVRFASGDVLQVDMVMAQRMTRGGKIKNDYSITRVIEYIPFRAGVQSDIFDYIEDGGRDEA